MDQDRVPKDTCCFSRPWPSALQLVICFNSYWLTAAQGSWFSTALSRFPAAVSSTHSCLERILRTSPILLQMCSPYQLLSSHLYLPSKAFATLDKAEKKMPR